MKRESVISRVMATVLGILLCLGLVVIAIMSALKPISVSLVKSVVVSEVGEKSASKIINGNSTATKKQKEIVTNAVKDNDRVEDLVNIYLSELSEAVANDKAVDFQGTSKIYDNLNQEIINAVEKDKKTKISVNKKKQIEQKLKNEELRLENQLKNMVNVNNAQNNTQVNNQTASPATANTVIKQKDNSNISDKTSVFKLYNILTSSKIVILLGLFLLAISLFIVILRWRSKGWLLNIGSAGIVAALIILLLPTTLAIIQGLIFENNYELITDNYLFNFSAVLGLIGILMVVIKITVCNKKSIANNY